jgi:NAD(P)-dependent dehydrogenase (short-subunit alcohol dehydrogenase family)
MTKPGLQANMEDPKPVSAHIPTEDGGYQIYKAAGKLQDKKAIITGGDSGIGRAVAILFAMEGASSVIVYLPEEEKDAQETKRRVEEHGQQCHCLAIDLRKKENCQKIIDVALQKMGAIDILVNNAAFQHMLSDISELDEYVLFLISIHKLMSGRDQWERTFDTNIHSFFYLSKYSLPHMKKGSTIINCASVNPYIGRGDLLDYTSTKGAIVAFTRALSNQQVMKGIRVNCVCPGPSRFSKTIYNPGSNR